jgi:hypothetical protein
VLRERRQDRLRYRGGDPAVYDPIASTTTIGTGDERASA